MRVGQCGGLSHRDSTSRNGDETMTTPPQTLSRPAHPSAPDRNGIWSDRQPVVSSIMTKLLDDAVATARALPTHAQDEIARLILRLAGADVLPPVTLSADEQGAIAASRSAAARGEFATDAQVQAVWAKHGL